MVMVMKGSKSCLVEKVNSGNVFFFAGSGVSYLSNMPSAGKVLFETARFFLPQEEEFKAAREKVISDANHYSIQPEVFYENLLYLINSVEVLSLWQCLSPLYLRQHNYPHLPNINHLYIAAYSASNLVPIFTTNFDCLFEEAAEELKVPYRVILPYTGTEKEVIDAFQNGRAEKNTAYIFKLHGSISSSNGNPAGSLRTTMNSISRVNFPVIDFIQQLCSQKHIVFVGYSGRDIDYFPEIKKRTLSMRPFWVDKFQDTATKNNCAYIDAVAVHCYPNELFADIKPRLNRDVPVISPQAVEEIFEDLKLTLRTKFKLGQEEKRLLLGCLIKEIGDYKSSYALLLTLYRNNAFSSKNRVILLINLSRLAHENSKYESCLFFAREALEVIRRAPNLDDYLVSVLSQISESRRMLIANDTLFLESFNYLPFLKAIASFSFNMLRMRRRIRNARTGDGQSVVEVFAIHDSIEHKIRFIALLQAFLIRVIDKYRLPIWAQAKRYLEKTWEKVRLECFLEGYSHGVANTFKFETRINWRLDELEEGEHIYDLTAYETGKGLAFRNRAEALFKNGDYAGAKEFFYDFFNSGISSGNNLNAVKALLGVARCNQALAVKPLLADEELETLKDLMSRVEGRNWQRHFSRTLTELGKSSFK